MGKTAFIFPGQGSQYIGMGLDLYNSSDKAKEIFSQFDLILEKDLSKLCFEGPEDLLKQTINTQPGILAVSIAAFELFKATANLKPDFVAGHSLGEYAALYAAGVLSLTDVIKIVQKRSELMNLATSGSMTAILGLNDEKLSELINKASVYGEVSIANYNTPDQTVITGEVKAVEMANTIASELGAKRVIPLAVSGAFHSQLMKSASEEFGEFIKNFKINNAAIPVITNVDSTPTLNKNDFSAKMVNQIYSSVYWKQSISYLLDQGVETFIEIGPGKVLSGMVKKISRSANVYNISDLQTLNTATDLVNNKAVV